MSAQTQRAQSATHVISYFLLDDVDQNVEERDCFDHHRAVTAGEDTAPEGEDELRYDAPGVSQRLRLTFSGSSRDGLLHLRHEEHGYTERAETLKDWIGGETALQQGPGMVQAKLNSQDHTITDSVKHVEQ